MQVIDKQGRNIDYMRISLTDRCNLRCRYCMPHEGIPLMNHKDLLSYEEIIRIVQAGAKLGIKKIRLTGGEPLLRKNITYLVEEINKIPEIEDIAITTNGLLLDTLLEDLVKVGLKRINLSLDTLNEETFHRITGFRGFEKVKENLFKAIDMGVQIKINAVPLKGYNDCELIELVKLTKDYPIDVRFIELMPIGCGKSFEAIPNSEILKVIANAGFSISEMDKDHGNGPAEYFKIDEAKGAIGLISPISHGFCNQCNRVRITPEGFLKLCLHSKSGVNLRYHLREGISQEDLKGLLLDAIEEKPVEHHFLQKDINEDQRSMNQIGG